LKRMMWTGDGYSFRKVVMMGSVWWFSSIQCDITLCWAKWRGE
jgi:hypothetical protein